MTISRSSPSFPRHFGVEIAGGKIYTPLLVLHVTETNYRKRICGNFETLADFLPQPNLLFMWTVAGLYIELFCRMENYFINEAAYLCHKCHKLLLFMYGYSAHVSYNTLYLLPKNEILFCRFSRSYLPGTIAVRFRGIWSRKGGVPPIFDLSYC